MVTAASSTRAASSTLSWYMRASSGLWWTSCAIESFHKQKRPIIFDSSLSAAHGRVIIRRALCAASRRRCRQFGANAVPPLAVGCLKSVAPHTSLEALSTVTASVMARMW